MTQLKDLKKSLENGLISKEEYSKKKKEIEAMPKKKTEEKKEEYVKLRTDKTLIVAVVIVVLIFALILGLKYITPKPPETIDELHEWNLKGRLNSEQGYLYRDVYSFVKFEDLWYTQLLSPRGSRLYDIQFRFGPRELEDIEIGGKLDTELFNAAEKYYVTFNPTGNDFSNVALAVADYNQHMTNIFFKEPIAACDRNETDTCRNRPIITCDNTEELVLYVKEADEIKVSFDGNCIIVEGSGFDLIKGIDRILFGFYKIIEDDI